VTPSFNGTLKHFCCKKILQLPSRRAGALPPGARGQHRDGGELREMENVTRDDVQETGG
jgi:hypothetical protein